ncbi:hypothetical protein ACFQ1M_11590 [Sungkyunkwania multivorans]|uniref:Uncharacterized protein n=1 Tax=Sungkyunkwania multivorans TaxID=1173618 RepID=A0ABW3D1J8_9FLAO
MKNEEVHRVYEELCSFYQGLKAEVIVAEALKKSKLTINYFDIYNKSTFARSYRRDIVDFELNTLDKSADRIRLNLARNGIYDKLPEGLFHEQVKGGEEVEFSQVRAKNKTQEKEARDFFAPLENEFFLQKVNVEENERKFIDKFTDLNDRFFYDFWQLDERLPKRYTSKLLKLLPYAHQIAGNLEVMAVCLERILGERTEITRNDKTVKFRGESNKVTRQLGLNMTLGLDETRVRYPAVDIIIGPIKKENVEVFVLKETRRFIEVFCDYFLPLEFEYDIVVEVSEKENNFVLEATNNPRMGLTTAI